MHTRKRLLVQWAILRAHLASHDEHQALNERVASLTKGAEELLAVNKNLSEELDSARKEIEGLKATIDALTPKKDEEKTT